ITRSSLYDIVEFKAKEHFCELWGDDHDCVKHTGFTQIATWNARQGWLKKTEEARKEVRARLAELSPLERHAIRVLLSRWASGGSSSTTTASGRPSASATSALRRS